MILPSIAAAALAEIWPAILATSAGKMSREWEWEVARTALQSAVERAPGGGIAENLKADDKELKEYISFGIFMLQNLNEVYDKLDVNGKGKLIGSIFDEKLVFLKNKYRTPKLKDGAAFIFNNNKVLQSLKTKKGDSREKVSSLVPEAGIEPALPKEQDFESSASTSSATRAYVK